MVLSPAPFHNSSTAFTPSSGDSELLSRFCEASVQVGQNAEGVFLPAVGSPSSLVADGNMVPAIRVPHMGIDSDNGEPITDQSGKSVRQLDDLIGLPDAFAAGAGSNDDDFGEDGLGLSSFADLAAGDNLGKNISLNVSDKVFKSSGCP